MWFVEVVGIGQDVWVLERTIVIVVIDLLWLMRGWFDRTSTSCPWFIVLFIRCYY